MNSKPMIRRLLSSSEFRKDEPWEFMVICYFYLSEESLNRVFEKPVAYKMNSGNSGTIIATMLYGEGISLTDVTNLAHPEKTSSQMRPIIIRFQQQGEKVLSGRNKRQVKSIFRAWITEDTSVTEMANYMKEGLAKILQLPQEDLVITTQGPEGEEEVEESDGKRSLFVEGEKTLMKLTLLEKKVDTLVDTALMALPNHYEKYLSQEINWRRYYQAQSKCFHATIFEGIDSRKEREELDLKREELNIRDMLEAISQFCKVVLKK